MLTAEESKRLELIVIADFPHIKELTCTNCPDNDTCDFAFDPYNSDGDCLAIK